MKKLRIKLALWRLWRLIQPKEKIMESWKGYRTIAFNLTMGLIALISAFAGDAVLPSGDDVKLTIATISLLIVAISNIVLRYKTDTKVFRNR